ncbi:MAG TPA: 6-hydroxymethylpterin diphosphokinase MptE-like protein, partial [Desulfatiglandales bacterium]|nr:6-hydroxymethylpterin diphosphokinase MptE-like protein [Desulfatiglandales bacterium]
KMSKKKKQRQSKLKKNLNALKTINLGMFSWLKEQPEIDWVQEIKSENGDRNLLIQSGSNLINAYPMDNPMKEAESVADQMNLYKENISIIIGAGLGYLCKAILEKMEKKHRVIVIEPIGSMIKLALSNFDFSEDLRKGNLIFLPGKIELVYTLHFLSGQFVISDWLLTTEKYTRHRPHEYNEIVSAAQETINQIMCNTGTSAGAAGGIIADNDIACMPYVLRHRGVNELKGLYKDKPAICVSTGPSLAKNIHHLIDLKDRAIIICVGQAIRPLLGYGIKPDFATTVDFGEVNIGHFKGLLDCNIPLVTINRTYALLIKAWQGPKFIAATPVPGYESMATGILTDKGFIEAGGSVAHLSFGLAQLLGCNPIAFLGQDLALTDGSHIPLADASGEVKINAAGGIDWVVKDPRCSLTGEGKSYSMGMVHYVEGFYGGKTLTNMGLMSFLTVFEGMISRHLEGNKGKLT